MSGLTSENDAQEHLRRILKAPGKAWLVVDPAGLVGRLGPEALSSGPDSFCYGTAETEIHEPYGPFAQIAGALSTMLARTEPEIVRRYCDTLWNLQRIRPWPTGIRPGLAFRSSLADYVLRGNARRLRDFFQGRNVSPRFTEDIVHFLVDAAHSRSDQLPLVLLIENVEDLDSQTAALARMVVQHLAGQPLCLVLTTGVASVPWLEDLVAAGDVESLEMPKPPARGAEDKSPLLQIAATSRSVLEACAVLHRPSHTNDLLLLLPERSEEEIRAALADLAGQRLIVLLDEGYVAVPRGARRELWNDPAAAERRRELHDRAQKALTKEDPFRSAHHAWEAGSKEAHLASLAAMEQAWAVSAYGCAEAHAHRALVEGKATVQVDSSLVFALLYYEAGRFEDSDRCFAEAIHRATGEETIQHLVWLRSYATIFGLRQYEKGLQPLRLLADTLESKGHLKDNLWVLNTLAFALFHLDRHQDAMAVEELALEKAKHLSAPDRFLLTILNLNLGRLHRLGSLTDAEEFLSRSLEQGRGEMDPFFLLLFYVTFARLYEDSGSPRKALLWYRRCEEIMMDIDVAGFLGRVFSLLAKDFQKRFGLLDVERLPRGEQAKLFLSFNMSLLYAAIGDKGSARKRMAWVGHRLEGAGYGETAARLAALLEDTERTAGSDSGATRNHLSASSFLGDSLEFVGSRLENQPSETAAQALAEGRSVAWVRGRFTPSPVEDSLALYDPASAPLRSALCADLGFNESEGGVLLLPDGRDLFDHVEDFPGVIQTGTLRRDLRQRWPGAQPIRTRVLLLDPDYGELFLLLSRFFQKTGTPMLGVFSFRLLSEDTAIAGDLASKYFLETCIECLVLGDTWIEKRPGITTSSLRNLCPRVSGVLIPQQGPGSETSGLLFSKGCYSKISPAGFRLLERCSGQRRVYELASDLGAAGREEEVCSFLLQLRRKGAVHFVRESQV